MMLQLDLSIIIIVFAALGFFTMGYFVGRNSSYINRRGEPLTIEKLEEQYKALSDSEPVPSPVGYPTDGIRAVSEPSGVIMRPTAQELKKMNEDEITKQSKEAVAKAFEEEPVL